MYSVQATYVALRNTTEIEFENTEAQFYQSVYSCDDVPYYDNTTSQCSPQLSMSSYSAKPLCHVAASLCSLCTAAHFRTVKSLVQAASVLFFWSLAVITRHT